MISFKHFLNENRKTPRASTIEKSIYKSAAKITSADTKKLKDLYAEEKRLDADPKSKTGIYAKSYNRISKARERIAVKYSLTASQVRKYSE